MPEWPAGDAAVLATELIALGISSLAEPDPIPRLGARVLKSGPGI
jgi:hypothetical protein